MRLTLPAALVLAAPLAADPCDIGLGLIETADLFDRFDYDSATRDGDTCTLTVTEALMGNIVYRATEARWTLTGADALATGGFLSAAELTLTDLRFHAEIGDPSYDYVTRIQSDAAVPIQADMSLAYDAGILTLNRFFIDFPDENAFEMSFTLSGVDPIALAAGAPDDLTFDALNMTLTSHGLFEAYALYPLSEALIPFDATDIPAEITRIKAEALAALADQPVTDSGSAALASLIDDMPRPRGTLGITLITDDGLRLMPILNPLSPNLEEILLDVTYQRTVPE